MVWKTFLLCKALGCWNSIYAMSLDQAPMTCFGFFYYIYWIWFLYCIYVQEFKFAFPEPHVKSLFFTTNSPGKYTKLFRIILLSDYFWIYLNGMLFCLLKNNFKAMLLNNFKIILLFYLPLSFVFSGYLNIAWSALFG